MSKIVKPHFTVDDFIGFVDWEGGWSEAVRHGFDVDDYDMPEELKKKVAYLQEQTEALYKEVNGVMADLEELAVDSENEDDV